MIEFQPVPGSRFNAEQTTRYGTRLVELRKQNGTLDVDVILADARRAGSPLHDGFEWDNSQAAELYRREQANYLVRVVGRVITPQDEEPTIVRGFFRVSTDEGRDEFKPLEEVAQSPTDCRAIIIAEKARIESAAKRLTALETHFAGSRAVSRATRSLASASRYLTAALVE
jgi:hypothetical protein